MPPCSSFPLPVLLVGPLAPHLPEYRRALRRAGAAVRHVRTIAHLQRWPRGHVVVCDESCATSWWKTVGATHLVVIVSDEGHDEANGERLDEAIQAAPAPEQLVAAVLACRRTPPAPVAAGAHDDKSPPAESLRSDSR
jgi:hypothetical protein